MDTVQKVIDKDLNPHVEEWEAAEAFPAHQVMKTLGSAGLLGITRQKEYGGLGLNFKYGIAFNEAMGAVRGGSVPMAVSVQTDMATPAFNWFGNDALKREWLAPTIAGDLVACLGVSEAGAGSDVGGIKTTAKRVGDDLVINGSKMWCTNGAQADWMCCLANTNQDPSPYNRKSLIVLPMKTKGVTVARKIKKMGMRASDTAEIYFDDVRVPVSNIIGDEGMGFKYQMMQFQEERLAVAAGALSPMAMVIAETVDYCKTRQVAGKPLIANQLVASTLAELSTELEMLRALVYRTVDLYMSGENMLTMASMCKLKTGRLAREVTDKCLQYWGGMGFTEEVLVSRLYRDLRLGSIGGGADEVMLGIIAKTLGYAPPKPAKK